MPTEIFLAVGSIMSQMDIGGGILAKEIAKARVVTVNVDGITFYKPINVGHVVCCYGKCTKIGNSSIVLKLEIWVKPVLHEKVSERYCVTEAAFTYVAIDHDGKSRKIKK
jgi:acyl-CoA thioesterase YciA